MQVVLVCVAGCPEGTSYRLQPGRPLRMQLRAHGQISGVLEIACGDDGVLVLSNRSQVPSQVNGVPTQSAVLRTGDRISYGSREFELCSGETRPGKTWGGEVLDLGDERMSPMEAAEAASRESSDAIPVLDSDGHQLPGVNGSGRRRRNSRRLSASRKAVIYKQRRSGGFLQRVMAQAFRRKDERQEELDRLEKERGDLLRHFGRLALEREGGLGLPRGFLSALCGGQTLTLRMEHLIEPELERYRGMHQRLRLLDAEILSLRTSMGLPVMELPVDRPSSVVESEAAEERTFRALDDVVTEDLCAQIDAFGELDDQEPEPAHGEPQTRVLGAGEVEELRRQHHRQAAG